MKRLGRVSKPSLPNFFLPHFSIPGWHSHPSMKTGVIVLAHRPDESVVPVAEWYARELERRGHRNVHVAYHSGNPNIKDVLVEMNVHGENNTFVVLPLLVAEGNLSVWNMPKNMGMPDNSCS